MAIAIRTGEETRQVQMVCLDELVGEDDVLLEEMLGTESAPRSTER